MTVYNTTPSGDFLFVTLLGGGMLYSLFLIRQWVASRLPKEGKGVRLPSGFSIRTLGIGLLVLGLTSGPVPAKEIFTIPSNGSFDFYQVDSTIQKPVLSHAGNNPTAWPGLETNQTESGFTFMDTSIKDSSLIIDPGFRVSLTNRIIKVAGRIVWLPAAEEFNYVVPSNMQVSFDMGKLNLERLTGVYELAWASAYDSQLTGNN